MRLEVKTAKFQELILKALKGASNNKIFPITSLMEIRLLDNVLSLITTDGTNYLKVTQNDVSGDNFRITVGVELISKLILKSTSDTVSLTLDQSSLNITSNGSYDIEMPLDENGDLIIYPYPEVSVEDLLNEITIPSSLVRNVIGSNTSSLALTLEMPALTAYYFDKDKAVASDSFVVAVNHLSAFPEPLLIAPPLMNLLSIVESDEIQLQLYKNNYLTVTSKNIHIIGRTMEELEEYPISQIEMFLELGFQHKCTISRAALLNILDRLSLFVEQYDENGVYLNFSNTGLIVSSKKNSASEKISYQGDKTNISERVCLIDITKLIAQLESHIDDMVTIHYGNDDALKISGGKITHIISLLGDSN